MTFLELIVFGIYFLFNIIFLTYLFLVLYIYIYTIPWYFVGVVLYIFNIPPRLLLYTCCHIPNFGFVASLFLLLYRIVIRNAEIDSEELKIDMEGIFQDRWCFCFRCFHFLWSCEENLRYMIELGFGLQVLIMDKLTVKIMSFSCKMADITEEGVSCK
jgi:predicted membrane channel-forming protein YqfA (hemolysin III family)